MNLANVHHLRLPPQRFYWALLDVESLPRSRRHDVTSLGYVFESVLPLPLEQVHATYASCTVVGRMHCRVGCAITRDELIAIAGQHSSAVSLAPESLPGFMSERVSDVDYSKFNLLTDEFEPRTLSRMKRRLVVQAALVVALISGAIILGQFRRAAHLQQLTADVQASRIERIESVVGRSLSNLQPPDLRLLAELRILDQTRGRSNGSVDDQVSPPHNILGSYVELATDWPRELPVRADSVIITPTSMTIRGAAPSSAIVQSLADALGMLAGWRLEQPQITAAGANGGDVQMTLQWKHRGPTRSTGGAS